MTQDLSLGEWPVKETNLSSVDETSWYYRRCLKIEWAVSGSNKLPIIWAVQTEVHWPPLRDDGAEIPSIHGKVEPTYSKDTSNCWTLILLLGFPVIFGSFSPLEHAKIIFGLPRSWHVEGSPIHKRGQQQHLRGLFPYGPTQVASSMSINISQIKYQSREPKWTDDNQGKVTSKMETLQSTPTGPVQGWFKMLRDANTKQTKERHRSSCTRFLTIFSHGNFFTNPAWPRTLVTKSQTIWVEEAIGVTSHAPLWKNWDLKGLIFPGAPQENYRRNCWDQRLKIYWKKFKFLKLLI